MHASLPMYDRAQTAKANDQFWSAIRTSLGFGPKTLTRDMDVWDIWQSPDLLLAQTCGSPYRARLHGHVTLIGTPDYGVEECAAGYYNSVFIARRDDTRHRLSDFHGTTFAYNDAMSQSGWAAPMVHMAVRGLAFASHVQSGGHVNSARMVAEGRADIAAIDAVTWAMVTKYDSFANSLQVIDRTEPTPGLPFIAAKGADKTALFSALKTAIDTLSGADRRALQIKGMVDISADRYLTIPTPAAPSG